MNYTEDQYFAVSTLEKWYNKAKHQVIEVSGVEGTGTYETIKMFIDKIGFDPREIMYLSFDQKQVIEMASHRYHCYYIYSIIYKYIRIVDFNTIPILNPSSTEIKDQWVKKVRKHIDPRYRIIVVFDAVLMNRELLQDLMTFDLPIILLTDPMAIPAPDSYTFSHESNIVLRQLNPDLARNPITYFANKALRGGKLEPGNYDTVSIVPKKNMNLYNLKSADMIITMSQDVADNINNVYRHRIKRFKGNINGPGERVIVMNNMYNHKLVNKDEKRIKVSLSKGTVCYISKCNRHSPSTRYVPIELKTEFYYEPFQDLIMDRNYLNGVDTPSRQLIPDEVVLLKYAYALPVDLTRCDHWDKVTLIIDNNDQLDPSIQYRFIYNAMIRAHQSMTVIV